MEYHTSIQYKHNLIYDIICFVWLMLGCLNDCGCFASLCIILLDTIKQNTVLTELVSVYSLIADMHSRDWDSGHRSVVGELFCGKNICCFSAHTDVADRTAGKFLQQL